MVFLRLNNWLTIWGLKVCNSKLLTIWVRVYALGAVRQEHEPITSVNLFADFESAFLLLLELTAKDKGIPQRKSWVPIRVKIVDENDNRPIFEKPVSISCNGCYSALFRLFERVYLPSSVPDIFYYL